MEEEHGIAKAPSDASPGASVLLVDDDKFLLDMYGMKFTRAGFRIEVCMSAREALERIRAGFKPDVVLIDLVMPEEDGFSFLKTLANERLVPGAIKIALTNQGDDAEKEKAAEMGVSRYIVKANMIPSEVVAAVKEELGKRR